MRFKLLGTEIYISFFFAALVTLMLACDRTGMALPMFFAIFAHEMGHLFAMWATDNAPKSVRLIPASVQITRNITQRYKSDITVALCGPIVNIILFLTLYFNYIAFKNELTLYYGLLNLIVAIFNLLPVAGLDGGTVLYCLLANKLPLNRAILTVRIITFTTAAAVLITAIILTVGGKINLSLYIIAIYLFISSLMKI